MYYCNQTWLHIHLLHNLYSSNDYFVRQDPTNLIKFIHQSNSFFADTSYTNTLFVLCLNSRYSELVQLTKMYVITRMDPEWILCDDLWYWDNERTPPHLISSVASEIAAWLISTRLLKPFMELYRNVVHGRAFSGSRASNAPWLSSLCYTKGW